MNTVVRMVAECLGVEYAKVLRYLPNEYLFILEAAVGFGGARVGTEKEDGGTDSQAGYTLLSHEPVIVEDFDAETRFRGPALLRNEGILSGISVIIQGDEAPYGVLGARTRSLRRFTCDDINFVQPTTNVLAQRIKRKAAEKALSKSEEKFREIAQRSFDMIYTCYHDRGITYMSPAVIRILGFTPAELIGCKCCDYVTPLIVRRMGGGAKENGERRIDRRARSRVPPKGRDDGLCRAERIPDRGERKGGRRPGGGKRHHRTETDRAA
jgi:PAS domain S-box-containing protein